MTNGSKRRPPSAVKPANRLTPKQDRLAAEYIIDLNTAAASRRAGISRRHAMALLTKQHFIARVRQLQEERNQRLRVDADWIMQRLVEEITADAGDLYDDQGALLPVKQWPL